MKQMNSQEFADSLENQKGKYGEEIVKEMLKLSPYKVFQSVSSGNHPLDFIMCKQKGKTQWRWDRLADVKTKAKMKEYNATGFSINSYETYLSISQQLGIRFYIFFVDEEIGRIYGNYLDILDNPYFDEKDQLRYPNSNEEMGIRFFSMEKMEFWDYLTPEQIETLKEFSRKIKGV